MTFLVLALLLVTGIACFGLGWVRAIAAVRRGRHDPDENTPWAADVVVGSLLLYENPSRRSDVEVVLRRGRRVLHIGAVRYDDDDFDDKLAEAKARAGVLADSLNAHRPTAAVR